jgi:hypothetical protein
MRHLATRFYVYYTLFKQNPFPIARKELLVEPTKLGASGPGSADHLHLATLKLSELSIRGLKAEAKVCIHFCKGN